MGKREYIENYLYRVDNENIDEMVKKVQRLVEKEKTLKLVQEDEVEKSGSSP